MALIDGVGVLLSDEIGQSTNPRQHAIDLISTMKREKIHWVAQQHSFDDADQWMVWLREGVSIHGWGSVGSWCQGWESKPEVDRAIECGSRFHLANVESVAEDQKWTNPELDRIVAAMPDGVGVIFTETPWGRDPNKTIRWRARGIVGMPEAIVSENPQATIPAMLDLARQLGWDPLKTAPCIYLTRALAASYYNSTIAQTGGRWSLFRYGDIDESDWQAIRTWPRPTAAPPPPPPPPPTGDPVYAELERLVNLFRAGSPNIAKAFDEVVKIMKADDAKFNALVAEHNALGAVVQDLVNRVDAAGEALR